MSEEATAPKKKGGKGKLVILIVAALIVGAGGAAGGLYATGAFSHAEAKGPKEDPNKPLLVRKGESPVTVAKKAVADAGGGSGGSEGEGNEAVIPHVDTDIKVPAAGIDLPRPADPSAYQATYYQMPAPYTSNLVDTDAFVQVALAISTFYDARVTDGLKAHETAIRSGILMLLSQEQEAIISTPEGKQALQRKLNELINKILREKTGYSGVDNVYFTNFVIQ